MTSKTNEMLPDPVMLPDAQAIEAYASIRTAVMTAHHQGDRVDAATSAALKRTACALEARMGSRVLRSLDALIDAAAG